jgi:hypothetical protein
VVFVLVNAATAQVDMTEPNSANNAISGSATANGYPTTKAFDNVISVDGRWIPEGDGTGYVTYRFLNRTPVAYAYRLTGLTGNNYAARDPKDFELLGSLNGTDWVELDARTGQTGWGDAEVRDFVSTNSTPYPYYRFNISANNGDTTFGGLCEIELFPGVGTPYPSHGATDVDYTDAALSWTVEPEVVSNYVYFGTGPALTGADLQTIQAASTTSYSLGTLEAETDYYWRIDTLLTDDSTLTGNVFHFQTAATLPEPTDLIAYEGFESYSVGGLDGAGGTDSGWTGSWNAEAAGVAVASVSLSYLQGDVEIEGGGQALRITNIVSYLAAWRPFDQQVLPSSVYFSALVRGISKTSGDFLVSLGVKGPLALADHSHACGFDFGYPSGRINAEVYNGSRSGTRVSTGETVQFGTTYLIVARVSRGGADDHYEISDVLVNPTTLAEPASGWTRATRSDCDNTSLDRFLVRTYFLGASDDYLIDEIRVGKTYEAVVPPPIPSGTLMTIQ